MFPPQIRRLEEIAREAARTAEPAHDFGHVRRVAASTRSIAEAEGADLDIVLPAALLHELFSLPKDHPDSPRSGVLCAERAADALRTEGYPEARIEAIAYCIRIHSFSMGVVPETLEAKVLQDADRLDALGAIGIARCFAVGAVLSRPFYDPEDPFARARPLDDKSWTLDHFGRKLLRLPDILHTPAARAMARERTAFIEAFLAQLEREIGTQE
jgi:uncharacterized protein